MNYEFEKKNNNKKKRNFEYLNDWWPVMMFLYTIITIICTRGNNNVVRTTWFSLEMNFCFIIKKFPFLSRDFEFILFVF